MYKEKGEKRVFWCKKIMMYLTVNEGSEQKQKGGSSDASSDQPSVFSSEILLPAPVLPDPDIVSVMESKQG